MYAFYTRQSGKLYFDISKYSHYALMRKQETRNDFCWVYFLILKIVYNVGKRACRWNNIIFVWILKMKEWYLIILSNMQWTMLKEI